MTNKNYNTKNLDPFYRVRDITINYLTDPSQIGIVSFTENLAIITNGKTHIISQDNTPLTRGISKADIETEIFNLIDLETGVETGETMTLEELFIGIASYARKIQKETFPDV